MFTLNLLYQQRVIDLAHLQRALVHFALDGLRYFAKFTSEALQPYIYFQIYAWKVYHDTGFLIETGGKGSASGLEIDPTKTLECLDIFSRRYLQILDCEDRSDGEELQAVLEELRAMTPFVQQIVDKVLPSV